jgi:hypothetical protein
MKHWFLERVGEYLKDHGQLSLHLMVADGDEDDRRYR